MRRQRWWHFLAFWNIRRHRSFTGTAGHIDVRGNREVTTYHKVWFPGFRWYKNWRWQNRRGRKW
ncbi:hypothetical protein LCGC14_1111740 [marine sediment metagenome]|uniref:Uncharacterized protein n=1 Tax=marine sediment metagenome TaxID=412755 RepID=A0A0F9QCL6_9ZZZZ